MCLQQNNSPKPKIKGKMCYVHWEVFQSISKSVQIEYRGNRRGSDNEADRTDRNRNMGRKGEKCTGSNDWKGSKIRQRLDSCDTNWGYRCQEKGDADKGEVLEALKSKHLRTTR